MKRTTKVNNQKSNRQIEIVIKKIISLDEKVETIEASMLTKKDGQRIMNSLEGLTSIAKNIREDHLFSIEWLKRIQRQIDRQQREIERLKAAVNIT